MKVVLENPVNRIRKFNFLAFMLLLIAVLAYQSTILLQNHYITGETSEFDLSNQDRLLSQKIEKDLVAALTAPDYFSRNRYIDAARQNINILSSNHNALLNAPPHTPLFHIKDDITRNVYAEADFYLVQMRDAVFIAVANNEKLEFSAAQQHSLRQAVEFYRKNQQLFVNLIDRATNLSFLNAKAYLTQMPWLSWSMVGLIFLVMILNHRLIYERSATAAKTQFYQLEEKLEFQNALLNTTHEAIITISPTGIITLFSASASRMFGYDTQEVLGKTIHHLMPNHLIDLKMQSFEVQGLRKNAQTFPLLVEIQALKTEHQHVFIIFMRDLTVEKQAEIKLLQAKKEAEEANKAKSQFLSNMSHELKTPLNAILGFSQLLETDEKEPLSPEQTECVQHIYKAGKLLLALISDVLDLSKIETGNVKLNIEEVSINEVILEALSLIDNIAKKHQINIKTRFDPLAVTLIKVDELRFKQILINLLSNAIKYNSKNGIIILRSKVEKNRVRISVKDSGKGIDESKLMELFQPFNRLGAENSEIEGTGIGLCIAKNLVERMGGTIGVTNNKDNGCCFWIEFPIVPQKTTPITHATETTKKLQDELNYIQNSLSDIGLIKPSPEINDDISMSSLNSTETILKTVTLH